MDDPHRARKMRTERQMEEMMRRYFKEFETRLLEYVVRYANR